MRKVEIALLILTPLAWIAAVSKWNQAEDLARADVFILLSEPALTLMLLIVVVLRFANRKASIPSL
jgi:hypothetical protein